MTNTRGPEINLFLISHISRMCDETISVHVYILTFCAL
jgi:hypothetical protein